MDEAAEPQPRALVVDDNLMFAMMIEPTLKRLGYAARTVSVGTQLTALATAQQPDLILINLTSTRFAATDLIRSLREQPATAAIPVIGYAGHVEREFLQAGMAAGATMVVPNSAIRSALPEVLAKLERILAGEPPEAD